jgi:hypothetical protein
MANRDYNQLCSALKPGRVQLFAYVTFDGSGNPFLDAANSKGVESVGIVVTDGYALQLTLEDKYVALLHSSVAVANGSETNIVYTTMETVSVDTDRTITFAFFMVGDGIGRGPPSADDSLYISLTLSNSNT